MQQIAETSPARETVWAKVEPYVIAAIAVLVVFVAAVGGALK
jgi:hypothetical protein